MRTTPAEDRSDRHGHGLVYGEPEFAHDNPRRRRELPAEREADHGHASGTSRSLLRRGATEDL